MPVRFSNRVETRRKMEILRDKYGKPQGTIREIAGGQERLYDRAGHAIATHHSNTNYTYDNNGGRVGAGNRLPGLVQGEE
jgi:hypothetical protein